MAGQWPGLATPGLKTLGHADFDRGFQPPRDTSAKVKQPAGFLKGIEPDHRERGAPSSDNQLPHKRHNPLLF